MEEFKNIFEGLDVAYGQHQSEGKRADGKQEGKSYIVKKIVTDDLWQSHLDGEGPSLGIIPIMADNTSRWGCIDIDTYPIDYKRIINSIRNLQLPLVPCRSKSGGLHIYLFLKEPVDAQTMRDSLASLLLPLELERTTEIYPKQIELEPDEHGNLSGNFISFVTTKSVLYFFKKKLTEYLCAYLIIIKKNGNKILVLSNCIVKIKRIFFTIYKGTTSITS